MRSGMQPSSGAAGSRCRAHTILFASVLVAGTLVTLSQRGEALSRLARSGAGRPAVLTPQQISALAATGLLEPHGVAPIGFPAAAADAADSGGSGGSSGGTGDSSKTAAASGTHSNAAADAHAARSAGRQPSSVDASALNNVRSQTAAGTGDAATGAARLGIGSTADGSSGEALPSSDAIDRGITVTDTEAAAADALSVAAATTPGAAPASTNAEASKQMATAAGGQICECPPMETEANAAARQAYGRDYLAICLPVKDQQADIREWVAHHAAVGAGQLYIYDTGSSPPLNETLQDHIASGLVQYIWWPPDFGTGKGAGRKFPQEDIYRHCLRSFGTRHQFIGFIDSDEFLIPKNEPGSVPALLQHMMSFEPFGALAVNWVVFGSSGHKERPAQGVLQAYTACQQQQENPHAIHIKSIVNTQYVIDTQGPHHFNYSDGMYAVNEHFQRVDGPRYAAATVDKIALHHYVLKSEQEFREKMKRGSAMGNHKPFEFFTGIDRDANLTCKDAVGWGPYQ